MRKRRRAIFFKVEAKAFGVGRSWCFDARRATALVRAVTFVVFIRAAAYVLFVDAGIFADCAGCVIDEAIFATGESISCFNSFFVRCALFLARFVLRFFFIRITFFHPKCGFEELRYCAIAHILRSPRARHSLVTGMARERHDKGMSSSHDEKIGRSECIYERIVLK